MFEHIRNGNVSSVYFFVDSSGNVNLTVSGTNLDTVSKPKMNTVVEHISKMTERVFDRMDSQTVSMMSILYYFCQNQLLKQNVLRRSLTTYKLRFPKSRLKVLSMRKGYSIRDSDGGNDTTKI
jgi:hypothetical protein